MLAATRLVFSRPATAPPARHWHRVTLHRRSAPTAIDAVAVVIIPTDCYHRACRPANVLLLL